MDCEDMQMIISEEPNLSQLRSNLKKGLRFVITPLPREKSLSTRGERKEGGKRGRKPGRKASNEKVDIKAKLERSRQSARECRARKKLRYQYLEELVADREKAVLALRAELERYIQWNSELNEGRIPNGFQQLLEEAGILKQEVIV